MRAEALALVALAACVSPSAAGPAPPQTPAIVRARNVGDKVTPFTGRDVMTGRTIGLEAGKVNLVWFWATWSIDNKAMPHVAALSRKYPQLNVVLVSVDDESRGIREFLPTYGGGDLHTIWDEGHHLASDHFYVSCSPTFFVVDEVGVVRHVECGFHDGAIESAIEPVVSALVK